MNIDECQPKCGQVLTKNSSLSIVNWIDRYLTAKQETKTHTFFIRSVENILNVNLAPTSRATTKKKPANKLRESHLFTTVHYIFAAVNGFTLPAPKWVFNLNISLALKKCFTIFSKYKIECGFMMKCDMYSLFTVLWNEVNLMRTAPIHFHFILSTTANKFQLIKL